MRRISCKVGKNVGKRAARRERQQSSRRCSLWVELLENRVAPSINPATPFELDGNVITSTTHDWDQIFADAGSPATRGSFTQGPTSGALAGAFITDAVNTNADDIFTGGGSKDILGIQQGKWLFTGSKPQGKDDITHAYATAYIDPSSGHLILYAGLDRFDNSGDATAGFWFFANNIGQDPNVTQNGGHPFIGTHTDGDILLVSDFTVGGSTSSIKVFRWTGNDSTGSLVALNNGNPINGNTFAIVNSGPISVPWSYTNKSGATQPAAGEFLEEGVDLTALNIQGCFSTFMAETRSSQSPTATLSDFALGSFPLCSLAAPQFAGLSKFDTFTNQGDSVTYPLTVENTGGMPLFIQSVSDTLLGNIVVNHVLQQPAAVGVTSITSSFNFSQALAPGASLTIFVTRTVQATDPDPTFNTTTFVGTDDLAGLDDPITTSVIDSVNLFQPSVSLTETASPTIATSADQVITYTFTVTNTSSADSPDLVLDTSNPNDSFSDTLLGNLEADAIAAGGGSNGILDLALGASFSFTETRAIQPGDPSPLTDVATAAFTLAQNFGSFPNVIAASASASVTLVPNLNIVKTVTGGGTSSVIHPGDTASFTITVSNTGAGTATNVVVTDQLPEPTLLTWSVASSTFDTTTLSASDFLTASTVTLAGGATISVTVSAFVPLDFFGNPSTGNGNGDAVPLSLFELDGNAQTGVLGTSGSTTTSHDWDQVFADNSVVPATNTAAALASSFATDAVNTSSDDIYTGGGSKDILGIQQGQWLFKNGKPQGKDDITHAYAALYKDPSTNDVILYAGLDRFDNSGDSTAGFWFLVNPIGENPNVTTGGGHPFTGTHTTGDILLVSDFTTGGSVSTIKVFEWVGNDATGSLVALNNGNPINGSTFAIVNGTNITLPWTFTNKSRTPGNVALPGEFLEEGVNLTGLGLPTCFSSFLAETRSSQSPTATLSDFVIGPNFQTCNVPLPNTATVQADGIAPITSNQVIITINDGDALLASSRGSEAVTNSLTVQQLQPFVAQAINYWRAAGVDPGTLSNLANVTLHVDNLPGAELGFESPGAIWIDQTAAGWGWSTDGAPGRMDLQTVVTHEVGHALGFEHDSIGVMEVALAPGVRLVPEALPSTGTSGLAQTVEGSAAPRLDNANGVSTAPAVSSHDHASGSLAQGDGASAGLLVSPTVQLDFRGYVAVPLILTAQVSPVPANTSLLPGFAPFAPSGAPYGVSVDDPVPERPLDLPLGRDDNNLLPFWLANAQTPTSDRGARAPLVMPPALFQAVWQSLAKDGDLGPVDCLAGMPGESLQPAVEPALPGAREGSLAAAALAAAFVGAWFGPDEEAEDRRRAGLLARVPQQKLG